MAENIIMPKLGFDMAEGTLVRWVKKEGETVNKGEVLAEIETDKATVEVEATVSGVVRRLLVDEGTVTSVGTPIAIVGTADEVISEQPVAPAKGITPVVEHEPLPVPEPGLTPADIPIISSPNVKASPLAKRIAKDNQVDLSKIKGTGPEGRIVRRDIEVALAGMPTLGQKTPAVTGITPPIVTRPSPLTGEAIPLTKLRQAIARRMTEAKTSIPHFYVTHEYKMDSLLDLRKQLNKMLPENEKVSVNDFIVKAVALALHQFPNLNGTFTSKELLRHGQINIGVAVAVEGGLMTVVCREADQKPLRQISAELKAMAEHARQSKVKPEDIEGSTFSISNLGMYEVENFAAIINPPEVAILAVGSAREIPVVENGEVKSGWRMKATISVDHRASDGVEAAKFMQELATFLEEPLRTLV